VGEHIIGGPFTAVGRGVQLDCLQIRRQRGDALRRLWKKGENLPNGE
jgi:hypothetical protein